MHPGCKDDNTYRRRVDRGHLAIGRADKAVEARSENLSRVGISRPTGIQDTNRRSKECQRTRREIEATKWRRGRGRKENAG